MNNIKIIDGDKYYRCCECGVLFPFEPTSIGAVGDTGIYCHPCSSTADRTEMDMWGSISGPTRFVPKVVQTIKHIAWNYK